MSALRPRQRPPRGPALVGFSGLWLVGSGLAAWALAARRELLPHDSQFLGLSGQALCAIDRCRILLFMVHDRAAFGGAVIASGLLYAWLARAPLARGERWAFWTLIGSGLVGFLSFLAYLQFGYLDLLHLWATLVTFALYAVGMALAWSMLQKASLRSPSAAPPLALGTRFGLGRAAIGLCAVGLVVAGATIAVLGSTRVFVPTDLAFMGLTVSELARVSPRLVPLIAHDRAGFGGALCCVGVTLLPVAFRAIRPGAAALWWLLTAVGLSGFGAAVGVHFLVGYVNAVHVLPAILGALVYGAGLALLRGPMCAPAPAPSPLPATASVEG